MERKKDYDFFRKMILRIGHVPEDLLEKFYKITSTAVYKKGDLFLRAGELSDLAALNCKGIFRLYYIDQDGNDFTKGFSTEGKFVISYSALVQRRPSFFNIASFLGITPETLSRIRNDLKYT